MTGDLNVQYGFVPLRPESAVVMEPYASTLTPKDRFIDNASKIGWGALVFAVALLVIALGSAVIVAVFGEVSPSIGTLFGLVVGTAAFMAWDYGRA